MEKEIDIPPFFLCPVSLEIMKDPVTTTTGITYDRDSIEKWLFSNKSSTCPVTKQALNNCDLTPNHTLRRMIQFWCTLNASYGIERIPTPKPPVTKPQIEKIIQAAKSKSQNIKSVIKTLRLIASENETNKRCFEDTGVLEFLASIISSSVENNSCYKQNISMDYVEDEEEALSLLYNLQLSETGFKKLLDSNKGTEIIRSLTKIMRRGSYESRVYAVLVMKSLIEVANPSQVLITNLDPEVFTELLQILHEKISQQASKAALQILIILCPQGRNRKKAVQAGAVPILVELLLKEDSSNKMIIEMEMTVLDVLCHIAEGRAEFLGQALGMAVVSKKILSVSNLASERAVNIIFSVGKFCGTVALVHEMLQMGVVAKMFLVLQSDCGNKTKDKARELLRLHGRVWKGSRCVPLHIFAALVWS